MIQSNYKNVQVEQAIHSWLKQAIINWYELPPHTHTLTLKSEKRTIYPGELNNEFSFKLHGYWVRIHRPEEGRSVFYLKCCEYNNKDGYNAEEYKYNNQYNNQYNNVYNN